MLLYQCEFILYPSPETRGQAPRLKVSAMIPEAKRRLAIGIIALVLLAAALVVTISDLSSHSGNHMMLKAAFWRVGAVMGLLWAAYDDLIRLPKWFFPVIFGSVVIVAIRPKAALVLVPIFLILAVLRPRRR